MSERPIVCLVLESASADGHARLALELSRHLDLSDWQLRVLSIERPGAHALEFQKFDVPVHSLDLPEGTLNQGVRWPVSTLISLFQTFRRLKPAMVHVGTGRGAILASTAARMARVPRVVQTFRRADHEHGIFSFWSMRAASQADVLIVPTPAFGALAEQRFQIHRSRISLVPPGVDLGAHAGSKPVALGSDSPRVGALLRLIPERDVPALVHAMKILARYHPRACAHVAGKGPAGLELVRLIQREELEGQARMLGPVDDVPSFLCALDLLVLPSTTRVASFAVLEAMAAGIPVVATEESGAADLLPESARTFVVPSGQPALLADAMDRLLTDAEARATVIADGRSYVRDHHRAAIMAAGYQRIFDRLLGVTRIEERAAQPFEC